MSRVGVNIPLMGVLIVGLGGAAYLLPFFLPINPVVFETAVLSCWGVGAALVVGGTVMACLGKRASASP